MRVLCVNTIERTQCAFRCKRAFESTPHRESKHCSTACITIITIGNHHWLIVVCMYVCMCVCIHALASTYANLSHNTCTTLMAYIDIIKIHNQWLRFSGGKSVDNINEMYSDIWNCIGVKSIHHPRNDNSSSKHLLCDDWRAVKTTSNVASCGCVRGALKATNWG